MSDVNGNNNDMNQRKRYYVIIAALIIIGGMVYWVKVETSPDVITGLEQVKQDLNITSTVANETKLAVVNLSENAEASIYNQRILAKGINDLGNIVIGDISDIKEATNLIDDIKFNTDEILNKTELKNVTLSNISPPLIPLD
jgi:hypothetical protein